MSICSKVGDRIRFFRKTKGLTQAQLGEQADLHHTYIGAIERGEKNISLKILERLAQALEVEIHVFFEFSKDSRYQYIKEEITCYLQDRGEQDVAFVKEFLRLLFQWRDESF